MKENSDQPIRHIDDSEFYNEQIKIMEKRYALLFEKWKVNWDKFYEYVKKVLFYKKYWIWIYLCELENFVIEDKKNKNLRKKLYADIDKKAPNIIGDFFKNQNYINSL